MDEDELNAYNWLCKMEVKSEAEATDRIILINWIDKAQTRIKQQNTEIKNLKEKLKAKENIMKGQISL